jgi:uncharacterized membrane protein YdfJ with MMPL/SSD domain
VVVEMIATGIIVDELVVRTLLVPALVAIMGRWNWWMSSGLARLLRIRRVGSWYPGELHPSSHVGGGLSRTRSAGQGDHRESGG